MPTISKSKEIEILDKAIEDLGEDSYLAPWLKSVRDEVCSLIRSDIFPSISLADARNQASKIKIGAALEAERIVKSSHDKADKIIKKAAEICEQHSRALIAASETILST